MPTLTPGSDALNLRAMRNLDYLALLAVTALSTACGASRVHNASALESYRTNKASIAVASVTVNEYSGQMTAGNLSGSDVGEAIASSMSKMITIAEENLANHFTVKPHAEFADTAEYRAAASKAPFDVFRPDIAGGPMPIFADNRDELIGAAMSPARAKAVCAALGTDMVAVVYSEWATKTGGFVPTTKGLAKNVLAIFDKNGTQLYGYRRDQLGKTIGAYGVTGITASTIETWVNAYERGIKTLISEL